MHPAAIGSPYLAKRMRYYENFMLPVLKTCVKAAERRHKTTDMSSVDDTQEAGGATKGNCMRATR